MTYCLQAVLPVAALVCSRTCATSEKDTVLLADEDAYMSSTQTVPIFAQTMWYVTYNRINTAAFTCVKCILSSMQATVRRLTHASEDLSTSLQDKEAEVTAKEAEVVGIRQELHDARQQAKVRTDSLCWSLNLALLSPQLRCRFLLLLDCSYVVCRTST